MPSLTVFVSHNFQNVDNAYFEKVMSSRVCDCSIFDVGLTDEFVDVFEGRREMLHRQQRRQLGRVSGQECQRHEPPERRQDPCVRDVRFFQFDSLNRYISCIQ